MSWFIQMSLPDTWGGTAPYYYTVTHKSYPARIFIWHRAEQFWSKHDPSTRTGERRKHLHSIAWLILRTWDRWTVVTDRTSFPYPICFKLVSVNLNTNSGRCSSLKSLIFHPKRHPIHREDESWLLAPGTPCLSAEPPAAPGSNTSVVRAPGHDGGGFPLHREEGNRSQKPKYHHDQELPMKEKVVAVEKRHGCANGLHKFKDCKGRCAVFGIEEP